MSHTPAEKYLRGLVRRLIKEAWNYTDHENCIFCEGISGNGFVNDRIHAPKCVGNEGRKYLSKAAQEEP